MKIRYLGHASFLITSDSGVRIVTDPYHVSEELSYGEIGEAADIVTVSHDHFDHNNVGAVQGNPAVVKGVEQAEVKGITFRGVPAYHDEAGGAKRGANMMFCFEVDGLGVCHLGDLGHRLDEKQLDGLGSVDILLVPVGGYYTVDAAVAGDICGLIKPRVIIPMHYKTSKCGMPIDGVDRFLKGKGEVVRTGKHEAEFSAGELPAGTQIVVLEPVL